MSSAIIIIRLVDFVLILVVYGVVINVFAWVDHNLLLGMWRHDCRIALFLWPNFPSDVIIRVLTV